MMIKEASQFYHLVKGLLRNKDVNKQCKLDIFKIYFKTILLYGAETWTRTKRENSKIQIMEIKFLIAISSKTKDRIKNTNKRLELGVEKVLV